MNKFGVGIFGIIVFVFIYFFVADFLYPAKLWSYVSIAAAYILGIVVGVDQHDSFL